MARAKLEMDITANGSQAKKEMREVKKEGVDAVEEIQAKNNEALKGAIGMFAPVSIAVQGLMALLAGIGESVRKYFAQGEVFVEWGKKAEISAHSVAYLKAQADSAGVSAKEFEQAMADLGAGTRTIEDLQKEWEKLGGSIRTATLATENFKKLARMRNFSLFGDNASNFFGGIASEFLEVVRAGGTQRAVMEQAVYSGKNFHQAMADVKDTRKFWHAQLTTNELLEVYRQAQSKMQGDRLATAERKRETTAKALRGAELSDEAKLQIFREENNLPNVAMEDLQAIWDKQTTAQERLAETIKTAVEEEKAEKAKIAEAEKRRQDEEAKARKEYESIVKKVASADIADGDLERIFKERTGETKTADEIRALAESLKTSDELMSDALKEATEDKRREEEMARKEREEAQKREEGISKMETAIKENFTTGGGLIGNANYGIKFGGVEQETLREMRQQTKLAQEQAQALASIEQAITED